MPGCQKVNPQNQKGDMEGLDKRELNNPEKAVLHKVIGNIFKELPT